MEAMVKSTRMSEVFTHSFSPQLLNRQKNTSSVKTLNTVETIELETLKDGNYHYETKGKTKELVDSFRESDCADTDDLDKQLPKSLSFQIDKSKPVPKLIKQKSNDVQSTSSLTNSLLTTKLATKDLTKKDKKDKKDKKKVKTKVGIKSQVSSVTNINEAFNKPIIKKPGNAIKNTGNNTNNNNNTNNKTLSPEKENPDTIRWRFELQDPDKEAQRIIEYKRDRRRRYFNFFFLIYYKYNKNNPTKLFQLI